LTGVANCLLINDGPQPGPWNMAVDEALLDCAAANGVAALRLYQWSDPTLSLGYFQPYAEFAAHAAASSVSAVRRLSGGGALLHDREITYSVCLPASHKLAHRTDDLYEIVHDDIVAVLADLGISASLFRDAHRLVDPSHSDVKNFAAVEPFLCFERLTGFDVVSTSPHGSSPCKIVGSAQRRRRGAVLQHGAILLEASPAAPQLRGVNDVGGSTVDAAELIDKLQRRLPPSLNFESLQVVADEPWRRQAEQLAQEKYACAAWTERR